MMNMQKVGTVSPSGNYFQLLGKRHKQMDCSLMCYTLCAIQDTEPPSAHYQLETKEILARA